MALPSSSLGFVDTPPPPPPPLTLASLARRCENKIQNPSFEYGVDPWLAMVSGSWATRGVYTSGGGGHQGSNFYYGHSNSTVDSTLTISQSSISIPNGGQVECAAWVASRRPGNIGSTRVEIFLDGQTCGIGYLGTTGWTRIAGKVSVSGDGAVHTLAVVAISDEASEEGWQFWLDDLSVGVGC
ncbi:hypothetical protein BKA66DRAFT_571625 [Pyrenochaeta sp. MPI-SDFR-AT-0127]|nr:hypothetical protein BKA66DRAFT_571625 [Pyrenochaeta sp. MPI-SDFR-AT-0127]